MLKRSNRSRPAAERGSGRQVPWLGGGVRDYRSRDLEGGCQTRPGWRRAISETPKKRGRPDFSGPDVGSGLVTLILIIARGLPPFEQKLPSANTQPCPHLGGTIFLRHLSRRPTLPMTGVSPRVVVNSRTEPGLHIIQDPASKLTPREGRNPVSVHLLEGEIRCRRRNPVSVHLFGNPVSVHLFGQE